jgi:hypothetical protein
MHQRNFIFQFLKGKHLLLRSHIGDNFYSSNKLKKLKLDNCCLLRKTKSHTLQQREPIK